MGEAGADGRDQGLRGVGELAHAEVDPRAVVVGLELGVHPQRATGRHLPEDDAEGEDVHGGAGHPRRPLGRHVARRSEASVLGGGGPAVGAGPGDAEVEQHTPSAGREAQVGGLQVAVHQLEGPAVWTGRVVEVVQGIGHLASNLADQRWRERPHPREERPEVFPINECEDDDWEVVFEGCDAPVPHDPWVVDQSAEAHFVAKANQQVGVAGGDLGRDLERHPPQQRSGSAQPAGMNPTMRALSQEVLHHHLALRQSDACGEGRFGMGTAHARSSRSMTGDGSAQHHAHPGGGEPGGQAGPPHRHGEAIEVLQAGCGSGVGCLSELLSSPLTDDKSRHRHGQQPCPDSPPGTRSCRQGAQCRGDVAIHRPCLDHPTGADIALDKGREGGVDAAGRRAVDEEAASQPNGRTRRRWWPCESCRHEPTRRGELGGRRPHRHGTTGGRQFSRCTLWLFVEKSHQSA